MKFNVKGINMKTFKEFILGKDSVKIISENSDYDITEIKVFSADGRTECPQGVYIAKGKWYQSIRINENAFTEADDFTGFSEGVSDEQYNLHKYRGGVIVFSTDMNAKNNAKNIKDKIKNFFKNKISTVVNRIMKNKKLTKLIDRHNKENIENYFIGAFSIGKFFNGRYIADNGKIYDEKSTSVEINGVPSEVLLILGTEIANEFKQETVLIKDLNKNKFYLADDKRVKNIKSELEKI